MALAEALERGEADLSRFVQRGAEAAPIRPARLPGAEPPRAPAPLPLRPARPRRRARRGWPATRRPPAAASTSAATAPSRRSTAAASWRCRLETVLADVAAQVEARGRAPHLRRSRLPQRPHPRPAGGAGRWRRGSPASPSTSPPRSSTWSGAPARSRSWPPAAPSSSPRRSSRSPTGVLERLDKGHTRAEALRAFELCRRGRHRPAPLAPPLHPLGHPRRRARAARAPSRPAGCSSTSTRCSSPSGCSSPRARCWRATLGIAFLGLDRAALTWRWRHPDPRMDALQPAHRRRRRGGGAARGEAPLETIARGCGTWRWRPPACPPARRPPPPASGACRA